MLKTINQNTVACEEVGASPECLVVLQGWGTSFSLYNDVASALANRYRVVLLDLPGFGSSPEPEEPWTVAQYADFVKDFIASLGVESVTLFAHSFGGRIVFELAAADNLPFAISGIILCDVAGIVHQKTAGKKMRIAKYKALRTLANVGFIYRMFPDLIDDWRSRQGSKDYRAASPMMKQVLVRAVNYDQRHLFGAVSTPTCIIWGERDTDTPLSFAESMHENIVGSTLAVIPEAGHFPFLENPGEFFRALEDGVRFLRGEGREGTDQGGAHA